MIPVYVKYILIFWMIVILILDYAIFRYMMKNGLSKTDMIVSITLTTIFVLFYFLVTASQGN